MLRLSNDLLLTDNDLLKLDQALRRIRKQEPRSQYTDPNTCPDDIIDHLRYLTRPITPTRFRQLLEEDDIWSEPQWTHKTFLAMLRSSPNIHWGYTGGTSTIRYKSTPEIHGGNTVERLSDADTE